MASVRAMVHVLTRRRTEPGEIVPLLAETISPDLEGGTFLTMLMVTLDPQTHDMTYVNAGHGPALLFHRDTRTFQSLKSTGLPLGFISDFSPIAGLKLTMGPGDLLILATDGLIELLNDTDDMFGRARLEQLIQQHCTLAAPDLVMAIQDAIAEFLGDSQPLDDVTLMVVERKLG
jgi:sigma-B regulation protein RsbU (phosphoserine phosphatase)